MVSIVSGNDLGVSTNTGSNKQEGVNLSREHVTLNSTTGNLVVQGQDEILTSLGVDLPIVRTYNSQGILNGNDIDTWQLSIQKRLFNIPSNPNNTNTNTKISREAGDGAISEFFYDTNRSLYVSTEGDSAHDTLSFNSGNNTWSWTSGTPGIYEEYNANGRLSKSIDADGNTQSYSYNSIAGETVLTLISNSHGQQLKLDYSDNSLSSRTAPKLDGISSRERNYIVQAGDSWSSIAQDLYGTSAIAGNLQNQFGNVALEAGVELSNLNISISGNALLWNSHVQYGYDALDRLVQVIVDLTPDDRSFALQDNNDADLSTTLYRSVNGQTYVTTYTYDGNSQRIASITQGDGTQMDFGYDAQGRVTRITDGLNKDTIIAYDGEVNASIHPQIDPNASTQMPNALGQVVATLSEGSRATSYQYDGNGNIAVRTEHQLSAEPPLWLQDFSLNADGLSALPSGYMSVVNGQLQITSQNVSSSTWESITGQRQYDFSAGAVFRSEVTTGASTNGRFLVVGADGGNRRHAAYFDGDSLFVSYIDNGYQADWIDVVKNNTTYVVEVATHESGSTLYVYEKGSARADGYIDHRSHTDWDTMQTFIEAHGRSGLAAATMTVDNVTEGTGLGTLVGDQLILDSDKDTSITYHYNEQNQLIGETSSQNTPISYQYENGELIAKRQHVQSGADALWTQDFSQGASGLTGLPVGYMDIVNGQLHVTSKDDNWEWMGVWGHRQNAFSDGVAFHSEVTTSGSTDGRYLVIGVDGDWGTSVYRRHAAIFEGDSVFAVSYSDNDYQWDWLGTVGNNSDYVVEVDTQANGTTLYVYEKGMDRSQGFSNYQPYTDWGVMQTFIEAQGIPGQASNTMIVDNLSESDSLGTFMGAVLLAESQRDWVDDNQGVKRYQTTITEADNTVSRYLHDGHGRIRSQITSPNLGNTLQSFYDYDNDNNLVQITKADGAQQRYQYSDQGRLEQQQDSLGNTTTYRYDSLGRQVAKIDYATPDALPGDFENNATNAVVTRYVYDSEHHLRFSITPEGDVTEHHYLNNGNRDYTRRFIHDAYSTGSLTVSDEISLSQMQSWVAARNLTRTQRTDYDYDFRGQIKSSTTYSKVSSNGVGSNDGTESTTRFIYDAAGHLLQQIDAKGSATSTIGDYTKHYVYDGLGRLITTTNANNEVASTIFDDENNQVITSSAAGLVTTSIYDTNGQLIKSIEGTQSQWSQDFATGLTGFTGNVTNKPDYIQVVNGRLVTRTQDVATKTWPNIYRSKIYNFSDHMTFRSEVTTGASSSGRYLLIGADNTGRSSGVSYRRHAAYFSGGNIYSNHYDAEMGKTYSLYLGKAQNNTSYVVEVESQSLGTTLYVYEKGQDRTSGFKYFNTSTDWEVYRSRIWTYGGPSRNSVEMYVDNMSESNSTVTQYKYDSDGKLRHAIDANGNKTYRIYDTADRLAATIDNDGSFKEIIYNANGKIQKTIEYNYQSSSTQLELLINTDGTPADVDIDSIRPRWTASNDRINQNIYDATGRLKFSIDADNYVTETRYDGRGLILDTIRYANSLTQSIDVFASADDVFKHLEKDFAQDRHQRLYYDADEKLVASLDGEGYLAEFTFDQVGRQTRTLKYFTRLPNFTETRNDWTLSGIRNNILSQQAVDQSAAKNINTYTIYNARGQITGVIDGEGYLTENKYDRVGNVSETIRYAKKAKTYSSTSTVASLRPTGAQPKDATDQPIANQRTQFHYNSLNQLEWSRDIQNTLTIFDYDSNGNVISESRYEAQSGNQNASALADVRTKASRFNARGQLISELNAEGAVALASATTQGQIDRIWQQHGNHYSYDAVGRLRQTQDQWGNISNFYYNGDDQLVYSVNANGDIERYEYNNFGNKLETTRYTRRIGEASTDTSIRELKSLTGGQVNSIIEDLVAKAYVASRDEFSIETYSRRGQLNATIDGENFRKEYSYNAFGELSSQRVQRGSTGVGWSPLLTNGLPNSRFGRGDEHVYDRRGLLTDTTLDTGPYGWLEIHTSTQYDAFGRAIFEVNGNRESEEIKYDKIGRIVETIDPALNGRVTTYDAHSRVLTEVDALQNTTKYHYNEADRSVTITSPEGISTKTIQNEHGDTVQIIDANNIITQYVYDKNGNVETVTEALGTGQERVTTNNYTDTNNSTFNRLYETTDANGNIVRFEYDSANRIVGRIIDPDNLNIVTRYEYDGIGRTIRTTEAYGTAEQTFTFQRYYKNGLISERNIDHGWKLLNLFTSYTYDAQGNVTNVETFNNYQAEQSIEYVYDTLGRRQSEFVDISDTQNILRRYEYDDNNNVIWATDYNNNYTHFIYNSLDQKEYTVNSIGEVVRESYDKNGRLEDRYIYNQRIDMPTYNTDVDRAYVETRIQAYLNDASTAPKFRQEHNDYDKDNRLIRVTVSEGNITDSNNKRIITNFAHDRLGNTIQVIVRGDETSNIEGSKLDREALHVYDALNREVYSIDALGYVNETRYDAMNNIRETIEHSIAVDLADIRSIILDANLNGQQRIEAVSNSLNRPSIIKNVAQLLSLNNSVKTGIDGNGNTLAVWLDQNNGRSRLFFSHSDEVGLWSTPMELAPATQSLDINEVDFKVHDSGSAIVSWIHTDSAGVSNIYARYYDGISNSWQPDNVMLNMPGVSSTDPKVAFDATGNASILWRTTGDRSVMAARFEVNTGWQSISGVPIESSSVQLENVKLSFSNNGNAIAAWTNSSNGYFYTSYYTATNDSWGDMTVVKSNFSNPLSDFHVDITDTGDGVIVWSEIRTRYDENGVATNFSYFGARNMSAEGVPSGLRYLSVNKESISDFQMSLLSNGNAQVLWKEQTGNLYALRSAIIETISATSTPRWKSSINLVSGNNGQAIPQLAKLVVDKNDQISAYWWNTDSAAQSLLYRSNLNSNQWQTAELVLTETGKIADFVLSSNDKTELSLNWIRLENGVRHIRSMKLNMEQHETLYIRDAADRTVFEVDALGNVTQYFYGKTYQTIATVRYANAVNRNWLSQSDNPLQTLRDVMSTSNSPDNQPTYYVYDKANRPVYVINALGYVTESRYNAAGKTVTNTRYYDAISLVGIGTFETPLTEDNIQSRLSLRINPTSEKDLKVEFQYDGNQRLIHKITAVGTPSQYQEDYYYDNNGNIIAETNGNGDTSYFRFDGANRQIRSIDAEGYMVDYEHDVYGNVNEQFIYMNSLYNLPETVQSNFADFDKEISYFANNAGFYKDDNVVNGDRQESFEYDVFGNQIKYLSARVNTAANGFQRVENDYVYDNFGNLVQTIQATGLTEERTIDRRYNQLNQVIKEYSGRHQGNSLSSTDFTEYQYDAFGNQVAIIDPRAHEATMEDTKWALDFRAAIGYVDDLNNPLTAAQLNDLDRAEIKRQFITNQQFDLLNRKTAAILPSSRYTAMSHDTGSITSEYDAFGNIIKQIDARGNVTQIEFDRLNRSKRILDAEGGYTKIDRDVGGNIVDEFKLSDPMSGKLSQISNVLPEKVSFTEQKQISGETSLINGFVAFGPHYYYDYYIGKYIEFYDGFNSINIDFGQYVVPPNLESISLSGSFSTKRISRDYRFDIQNKTIETFTINQKYTREDYLSGSAQYGWIQQSYYQDLVTEQLQWNTIDVKATINYYENGILKSYTIDLRSAHTLIASNEQFVEGGRYHKFEFDENISISNFDEEPIDSSDIAIELFYINSLGETRSHIEVLRYIDIKDGYEILVPLLNGESVSNFAGIKYELLSENYLQTHNEYDVLGYKTSVTDAEGATEEFSYNAIGNMTLHRNKNGNKVTYQYDALGNKIAERLPISAGINNGSWSAPVDVAANILEDSTKQSYQLINVGKDKSFYIRGATAWEYDIASDSISNPTYIGVQPNAQGYMVGENGNVIVMEIDANNRVQYAVYKPESGWQPSQTLSYLDATGKVALAGLPGDIPLMISYVNNYLHASTYNWDTGTWKFYDSLRVEPGYSGDMFITQPVVSVRPDGTAFVNFGNNFSSNKKVYVAQFDISNGWDSSTIHSVDVNGWDDLLAEKRLGFDGNGNAYLAYSQNDNGTLNLKMQKFDASKKLWDSAQIVKQGESYFDYKMVVDNAGRATFVTQTYRFASDSYEIQVLTVPDSINVLEMEFEANRSEIDIVIDNEGRVTAFWNRPSWGQPFIQRDATTFGSINSIRHTYSHLESMSNLSVLGDGTVLAYGDSQIGQYNSHISNSVTYDAVGNKKKVASSDNHYGRTINFTYNKNNNLEKTEFPGEYSWNALRDRKNVGRRIYNENPTETAVFDAFGNMVTQTNRNGFITRNEYDANNRLLVSKDAAGYLQEYSYDNAGNLFSRKYYNTSYQSANQKIRDDLGNRIVPVGSSVNHQEELYDGRNKLITSGTGDANVFLVASNDSYEEATYKPSMTYVYDGNGNALVSTDILGNSITSFYNKNNSKTAEIDAAGYLKTWSYDVYGNRLSETRHSKKLTDYSYLSNISSLLDQASDISTDRVSEFRYDGLNREIESRLKNIEYSTVYNSFSPTSQRSSNSVSRTYYDNVGNVIRTVDAEGNEVLNKYDAKGRLIEKQEAKVLTASGDLSRPTTIYKYNSHDDIVEQVKGYYKNNQFTAYEYTPIWSSSPIRSIRKYEYNNNGWLVKESGGDGIDASYYYDLSGNIVNQIELRKHANYANNKTKFGFYTNIYYDGLNREVLRSESQFTNISEIESYSYTEYNADGNITYKGRFSEAQLDSYGVDAQAVSPDFKSGDIFDSAYRYDELNENSQEYYEYNQFGNLVKTNSKDGSVRFYYYDAAGNSVREVNSYKAYLENKTSDQVRSELNNAETRSLYNVRESFYDQLNRVVMIKEQPQNLDIREDGSAVQIVDDVVHNTVKHVGVSYDNASMSFSPVKKFYVKESWTQHKTLRHFKFKWNDRSYKNAQITIADLSEFTGLFSNISITMNGKSIKSSGRYGGTFTTAQAKIPNFQARRVSDVGGGNNSAIIHDFQSRRLVDKHFDDGFRDRDGWEKYEYVMPSYLHFKNQPKLAVDEDATIDFALYYKVAANGYTPPALEISNPELNGFTKANEVQFDRGYYLWDWQAASNLNLTGDQVVEFYYVVSKDVGDGSDPSPINSARGVVKNLSAAGNADTHFIHIPLMYDTTAVDVIEVEKTYQKNINTVLEVTQRQEYTAFGEVNKEFKLGVDQNGNPLVSEFTYNKMGKLIERVDPRVMVTNEYGMQNEVAPTTRYHYDRLGRLVETIDANNIDKFKNGSGYDSTRQTYNALGQKDIYFPEGGRKIYRYDNMGNVAEMNDLVSYTDGYRTYKYEYDTEGRVITMIHPGSSDTTPIVERFLYNETGNRIEHINVFGNRALTMFDAVGRVNQYRDFNGATTVYSYDYRDDIGENFDDLENFVGTTGGYRKTTQKYYDRYYDHVQYDDTDYFDKKRYHVDMGNRQFRYYYDWAGRLRYQLGDTNALDLDKSTFETYRKFQSANGPINLRNHDIKSDTDFDDIRKAHLESPSSASTNYIDQFIEYEYYDNNLVKQITDYNKSGKDDTRRIGFTQYQYDDHGRVILEEFGEQLASDSTWQSLQSSRVDYDAAGHIIKIYDPNKFSIEYEFDAVGNRKRVHAQYYDGPLESRTQDLWYKYDDHNRFTTTMGELVGATGDPILDDELKLERERYLKGESNGTAYHIERGDGYDVQYNKINERKRLTYDSIDGQASQALVETYDYDERGHLTWVRLNSGSGAAPAAYRKNDIGGRVVFYKEYRLAVAGQNTDAWHTTTFNGQVYFNTSVHHYVYNNANQKWIDTDYTFSNNYVEVADFDTDLGETVYSKVPQKITTKTRFNYDDIGNLENLFYERFNNGESQETRYTQYSYSLWSDYKKSTIKIKATSDQVSNSDEWAPGFSNFSYNSSGQVYQVEDLGKRRRLEYNTNQMGQIVRRAEHNIDKDFDTGFKQYRYYYLQGKVIGEINDVIAKKTDYAGILADLDGSGNVNSSDNSLSAGREGDARLELQPIASRVSPVSSADFDQNYQPISPSFPALTPTTYTLSGSEQDWESVALTIWGDSSLWYLLVEANANVELGVADQRITIPNVITNIHNNADTFRPYNAGDAMGNTSPSIPEPPPPPEPDKCKQAIIIIVVVAVSIWTGGAMAAAGYSAFATGAAAGAASAFAGQVTGNAINAQGYDGIDFGAVVEGAVIGGFAGWASELVGGANAGAQGANAATGASSGGAAAANAAKEVTMRTVLASMTDVLVRQGFNYLKNGDKEGYEFDWGALAASAVMPFVSAKLPTNVNASSFSAAGFAGDFVSSLTKSAITESVREITWKDYEPDWDMVAVDALATATGTALGNGIKNSVQEYQLESQQQELELALTDFEKNYQEQQARRAASGLPVDSKNIENIKANIRLAHQRRFAVDGSTGDFNKLVAGNTDFAKNLSDLVDLSLNPSTNDASTIYGKGKKIDNGSGVYIEAGHNNQMLLLRDLGEFNQAYQAATQGVPIEEMVMAAQAAIFGPASVLVNKVVEKAVEHLAGDYIAEGIDVLSNNMIASAHNTDAETAKKVMSETDLYESKTRNLVEEARLVDTDEAWKAANDSNKYAAAGRGLGVSKDGAILLIALGSSLLGAGGAIKAIQSLKAKKADREKAAEASHKLELQAKQNALNLEALDGGHSIARHGPEVSDADLIKRLETGITQGDKFSPTPASTRFNSYQDWEGTRADALLEIGKRNSVDLSKAPGPNDPLRYNEVVEHGRAIDDGFVGVRATAAKVGDIETRKIGKVYPDHTPVEGITRTTTTVAWNQTKVRWDVVQHFPSAKNWNQTTRSYDD